MKSLITTKNPLIALKDLPMGEGSGKRCWRPLWNCSEATTTIKWKKKKKKERNWGAGSGWITKE